MNDSQDIIVFSEDAKGSLSSLFGIVTWEVLRCFWNGGSSGGYETIRKRVKMVEECMSRSVKERRIALGLSRAELGEAAYVDRRILQLLELNQLEEKEAAGRIERALTALENGDALPNFKAEVDALRG